MNPSTPTFLYTAAMDWQWQEHLAANYRHTVTREIANGPSELRFQVGMATSRVSVRPEYVGQRLTRVVADGAVKTFSIRGWGATLDAALKMAGGVK